MSDTPKQSFDRRRFLHASAALATTASLAPPALGQAPAAVRLPSKLQLKFATIAAESFPYVDGARRWKELLETRSGGTIEMQIFHSASLGSERTINEGVLGGSINAGIGAGAWAGFVASYNVVSLPFLIRDLKDMARPRAAKRSGSGRGSGVGSWILPSYYYAMAGTTNRRIGIVGAGALGGYVGGWLAQLGQDVTFIDPWPQNVETIRAKGL
ncbi:MAG: hypothetical protein FJX56_13650, partial [Alphaproteobacteria bacterium]|nr:hypothetical protein [Alphaproteobacteria bacterium]